MMTRNRYPKGFKGFYARSRIRFNPNRLPEYGQWEAVVELRNRAMQGHWLLQSVLGAGTRKAVRQEARKCRAYMWRVIRQGVSG